MYAQSEIMDITQNEEENMEFCNEDALTGCRACLSTDGRMFDIHEYRLADVFAQITGTPVIKDKHPQTLCAYCGTQLLKCASFRDMCLEAQRSLSELFKGKLDTDYTQRLKPPSNRFLNLTITNVETLEYVDPPADGIKDEPNIDIIDIDYIIKQPDLKEETEHKNDKRPVRTRKRKIEKDKDKTTVKRNSQAIKNNYEVEVSISDTKIKTEIEIERIGYNEFDNIETKKEEIESDDNNYDIDDDIPLKIAKENVKRKNDRKAGVKKKELKKESKDEKSDKEVKRRRKKEGKRQFRDPANDNMPIFDFAKFESAHAVKIIALTKEEQMDEINLRKKTRNYLESNFRCDDCGRGFDAEAAYNNHLLRHSPSEGQYPCEICGMRFKLKCMCQRHQDVHRLKFICNECNYVSRDRYQARRHHAMHTGKTYECQHCGKIFNKSSTYLSHVRMAHPALNAACDVCGETFVGQLGLKLHKSRAHAEKPPQIKCSTCSAVFNSIEALNRHTDTAGEHRGLRPCEQCGENCATETELQEHVKERHPKETYNCTEAAHLHGEGQTEEQGECGMSFPSAAACDLHHKRKHLGQRYTGTKMDRAMRKRYAQRPQPKGVFVCEQCGRVAKNATLLRYHQRSHQEVKPFACNLCPKSFPLKTALEEHIRSHTGEKPYQCPECPLAFSLKGNFNRHHKTAHQGLRANVPCSICGRVFSTKAVLRTHVNTVHHGQPWPKRDRNKRPKGKSEMPMLDNK